MTTLTDTRVEETEYMQGCDFCRTKQADVFEIEHYSAYSVGEEVREDYTACICLCCYRAMEEGDLQI